MYVYADDFMFCVFSINLFVSFPLSLVPLSLPLYLFLTCHLVFFYLSAYLSLFPTPFLKKLCSNVTSAMPILSLIPLPHTKTHQGSELLIYKSVNKPGFCQSEEFSWTHCPLMALNTVYISRSLVFPSVVIYCLSVISPYFSLIYLYTASIWGRLDPQLSQYHALSLPHTHTMPSTLSDQRQGDIFQWYAIPSVLNLPCWDRKSVV